MSDKPSLYVVEKKEVVILVVLFVLVTVLSFTMGVRYGESVGKKAAREQNEAQALHGGHEEEQVGGTLGAAGAPSAAAGHGDAKKADEHGKADDHAKADGHSAPAPAPGGSPEAAASRPEASVAPAKAVADKNADEYLLNALKETGVEPPGGKPPGDAKLPAEVKRARSGAYVIQVGSHPTRGEAESQVRQLKAKKVQAEILSPFKDRQGEWHRVVVGSYKTKRDAEKDAVQWKGRGAFMSYFVWRLP